MPSTVAKESRSERLVARISVADKRLLERAADMEGRSVASFVVTHAREVAKRIVRDDEIIRLNAEQSRRFVEALLRPTPPAPAAFKKAMAAYRQKVVK